MDFQHVAKRGDLGVEVLAGGISDRHLLTKLFTDKVDSAGVVHREIIEAVYAVTGGIVVRVLAQAPGKKIGAPPQKRPGVNDGAGSVEGFLREMIAEGRLVAPEH